MLRACIIGYQLLFGRKQAVFPLAHMQFESPLKCPKNPELDALSPFLRNTYCEHCAQFDDESFIDNWHQIYFVVFSFICRFNRRDQGLNQRDPVMAMVASEIWLHNIGRLLERNPGCRITPALNDDSKRRELLPKCNSYSLAQYLGLPPQTVRRKVQALVDLGWVMRSDKGELSATAAYEAEVMPECNLETMRDFISSARTVLMMVGIKSDR